MKISESDFRRLHWKSRKLDDICRIIWPDVPLLDSRPEQHYEQVQAIEGVIGEYRPGPLRTVDAFLDGEKVTR